MNPEDLIARYVRGIGLSSAPFLDALWTPRENQDATVAAMLGLAGEQLAAVRAGLREQLTASAAMLLSEEPFTEEVARLPFGRGDRLLIVGDSISADALSWANLLAAVLERAGAGVQIDNRAVPGRTTAETLYGLPLAAPFEPTHALVMLGTNDTRRVGSRVGARMASLDETERNLDLIRRLATEQLGARVVVFVTPPPVDPAPVSERRAAGEWNEPDDVAAVAAVMRRADAATIDLHGTVRPGEDFFDVDGLHPTPAGQVVMLRTVVALLAAQEPR